ncbi:MAG: ParA family protein, partial [Candidatus Omnitrophica bacterium]|nr:ParA family protein [Candidatus Omnitrophota bacterium]
MRTIAIANQKGGCGKTTTAINLSASLAFLQKRVLLIDLDPQGHSTCGLGIKAEFLDKTSYDLFQDGLSSISELILPVNDYLSLIPTHVILGQIEQERTNPQKYNQKCLASRIAQLEDTYDYVMIDSPPNLGLLTFNALSAAGEVIIPIEPSFFSLHGLAKIFETLDSVQKNENRKIRIHALMTRFEKRIKLSREIQEEVRKHFKEQMFICTIDENIRLKEAAASGKSIVDFDRESVGFRNYMGLAIEVIERGLIWQMAHQAEDIKET